MIPAFLFLSTCFLAFSNGANDNFKGVATLFGSDTINYRTAIWWASGTTLLGSISSVFVANSLLETFSGKEIVPDSLTSSSEFFLALSLAAACTVMLATVVGLPISTTHALTGALAGAGIGSVGTKIDFSLLGSSLFLPLVLSPLAALIGGCLLHSLLQAVRKKAVIVEELCICVSEQKIVPMISGREAVMLRENAFAGLSVWMGSLCKDRVGSKILGVTVNQILNSLHFLSAGAVSFARGLNDTPKILALLTAIHLTGLSSGVIAVAFGMAAGGLLQARKVALTMSKRITPMNQGQGLAANLITSILVVTASGLGLPVSTTHVSVGSLLGIGVMTKKGNIELIRQIILAWIVTVPLAAVLGGIFALVLLT